MRSLLIAVSAMRYMAISGDWKLILTAILGVFVSIAALLLIAWLFYEGAERTQRSPRVRRAFFVSLASMYSVWMVIGIVQVIRGRDSTEAWLGLPGGLLLIWLYLRAA